MRLPKRGFVNVLRKIYEVVNIRDILNFVEKKKLDTSAVITKKLLKEVGLVRSENSKIKLIMGKDSTVSSTVKIAVDTYSQKAKIFSV
jgi:ribosomal protein L15